MWTCNLFVTVSPIPMPQTATQLISPAKLISSASNEDLAAQYPASITNLSQEKGDIFHQFDALPLTRSSPITPDIFAPLISATFIFNDEDYKDVECMLHKKVLWTKNYTITITMSTGKSASE